MVQRFTNSKCKIQNFEMHTLHVPRLVKGFDIMILHFRLADDNKKESEVQHSWLEFITILKQERHYGGSYFNMFPGSHVYFFVGGGHSL